MILLQVVKMFRQFGIMIQMVRNIDIMLIFSYLARINVLKLNHHGQLKNQKVYLKNKKQEKNWDMNMKYGYMILRVIELKHLLNFIF